MTSVPKRLSILVAAPQVPMPDTNSADRRFTALLRMMAEAGHRVDFCRLSRWDSLSKVAPYERALGELGISVAPHPGAVDWQWLDRALCRRPYDIVFFEYWHAAKGQVEAVRSRQPRARVVVDSVDVHFARKRAELEVSGPGLDPELRRRAEDEERDEIAVYRRSDAVVVVTEEDRQVLTDLGDLPPLHFLPNIVPPRDRPPGPRGPEVVFIGGFRHAPNVDGVVWFAREIWPAIRREVPEARLSVIGYKPLPEVLGLHGKDGIDVLGYVPSTDPYLDRAAVVVAPLRFGAGMKGKVTEAMAAGAPVVSTTIGAQGFGARHGEHLMIADDPASFAAEVVGLLKDQDRAERLGAAGRDLLARLCSPEVVAGGLDRMLGELTEGRRPARPTPGWAAGVAGFHGMRLARAVAASTGLKRPRPPALPVSASAIEQPDGPAPAVSVLMPAYNAERYIAEAIESILDQSFADFELIVIDDGSTDRTRLYLDRYAGEDRRVRVVSRPNTGIVATLNELIGMAKAPLIARMDADDVALPGRFERQVAYLRDHPEVVCIGGRVVYIDDAGRVIDEGHPPKGNAEVQAEALTGSCPLCHPSVMMRTEAVRAVGGYRPEMEWAEDLDLWLRLGEIGQLVSLPEPVHYHRLHDRSISVVHQFRQADRCRAASDEACARRGLPPQYVPSPPWRPFDRASRMRFYAWCGWSGFKRGDRRMAIEYGLKAVGITPWRPAAWRLLICALAKQPPGSATIPEAQGAP